MKKKNTFMRLAMVLVLLVLVTTSAVGGTFAKYVTDGSADDSARVAKFGVNIVATSDAFSTEYKNTEDKVTVKATEKVLAPGTSGTLATVELTGKPEVAVNVAYTVDLKLEKWQIGSEEYCPLIFKIGDDVFKIDGSTITDVAGLEAAVEGAFTGLNGDLAVNSDVSAKNSEMTWEWAFDGDDEKDTALGNQAANGNHATISLEITCTVTQID